MIEIPDWLAAGVALSYFIVLFWSFFVTIRHSLAIRRMKRENELYKGKNFRSKR